jgi:hypothetical protein
VAKDPVVAGKVVEMELAGTRIDDGTVRVVLVLDRVTLAPPTGAPPVKVTVQVELLDGFKLAGRQDTALTAGPPAAPVTVPPVAETEMAFPAGDVPKLLFIPMVVGVVATVRLIIATVPFAMIPASVPETTHVYTPEPAAQVTVLPAAVAAVPGLAEMVRTLPGE